MHNIDFYMQIQYICTWAPFDAHCECKRRHGCHGKSPLQGLHMTHVNFMLVYNLKIYILNIQFNTNMLDIN